MKALKRFFWIFLTGFVLLCLYLHLSKQTSVATLTITGVTSSEEIEWKNPSSPMQKETVPTHEVFFSFPGEPQVHAFFWGDLIGVRYKQLELRSFWMWMGWSDFIEVEALCSDYLDLEKKAKYPSKLLILTKGQTSSFAKMYRSAWKSLFLDSSGNFFIKKATLQTKYFPLENTNRSFQLSCHDGKLVSD